MGRRSSTESVARIFAAFLRQRTWSQAALARELEIGVPAVRKRLEELTAHGMPLECEADAPHVYWSVPANWFPDSVAFSKHEITDLLHVLRHATRSPRREKLLKLVVDARRDASDHSSIVTPQASGAEDAFLPVIEEAMAQKRPVRMRFYSSDRGVIEPREASVHRVDVGPPARLVATCHRSGRLKWFRVDNIAEAHVDRTSAFRASSRDEVDRFCAESIDGFRGGDVTEEHVFFVREPEARWVTRNLLPPMRAEAAEDGVEVRVTTTGALRVARYVVGLGAAARAETAHLRGLVEELARGALRRAAQPRKLAKTGDGDAERPRSRVNR